jgi:hypothetical protein
MGLSERYFVRFTGPEMSGALRDPLSAAGAAVIAESTGHWKRADIDSYTVRVAAPDPEAAVWKVREILGDRPYDRFDVEREIS